MRNIWSKYVCVVILQFVLVTAGLANTLTLSKQGDIFAETDRYQVRFRNGNVIHVHNKLTKETYTVSGRHDATLSGMRGPRFDALEIDGEDYLEPEWEIGSAESLEVEKISPLAVKLTARWHQSTLLMWVVIDVLTGDLIIRQEGFSEQTGISTIGWGIGNLDYNQVSPIVPAHGGKIMNKQNTVDSYWTYPHLWQAPLAVVQGTLGGCVVMSEDETNQFKALGQWPERKKPNFFAIAFDTHNFFPFEDRQHITSATWRFNTYRGDWRVPAERYRQGMIQRNASRLARRPAWVKDIQIVIMYCSLHRPQHIPRMLDFLAQQINPKNVLIYCRSGWDHEHFGSFASQAKARGFRVMSYSGFQFVDQDHPLYFEWEPFLYQGSDGNILGWNFDHGGPAFINPAASAYRKFHVQTLKNVQETYNIDAFHLDLNYFIGNHAPIDGLTPIQGNMLLHEELIAAMPDIAFSGEFIHAVTSPYLAFYGTGDNPGYGDPHPISDFLFSQWSPAYSGTFAYLAQKNVKPEHKHDPEALEGNIQELEILNAHIKTYKQLDVVPTIRYYYESHFAVYQAISILHRTNSNTEFWEGLEQMVNTYREDLNLDGVVNILDLVIVANAVGDAIGPDLNGDDVVNILDLVIVANALN